MNLLLHTIALEPARWTPRRVSQPLPELLPHIAAAGFSQLEVYEPHLTEAVVCPTLRDAFATHGLEPVILSSYLDLNPARTPESALEEQVARLDERLAFYGFQKVRLFPGQKMNPTDQRGVLQFRDRLRTLAQRLPHTELLLETHDHSLADDPALLVRLLQELDLPNLGLLFQPTFFTDPEKTLAQTRLQKPFIRHLHLQNRHPDETFATLADGVVPWDEIFALLGPLNASLEFVPAGICPPEAFDLATVMQQAADEAAFVRKTWGAETPMG